MFYEDLIFFDASYKLVKIWGMIKYISAQTFIFFFYLNDLKKAAREITASVIFFIAFKTLYKCINENDCVHFISISDSEMNSNAQLIIRMRVHVVTSCSCIVIMKSFTINCSRSYMYVGPTNAKTCMYDFTIRGNFKEFVQFVKYSYS